MIVFKTFLKVLNKNKVPIILYTVFLLVFGGMNMQTSDNNMSFIATKPDVLIINKDEDKGITKDLINYIKDNSNIIDIKDKSVDDALFYRDVNYVIYIPENYSIDFMNKTEKDIKIKSTGDYQASLANMLLTRYLKTINIYREIYKDEDTIIKKTSETLKNNVEVEVTSRLNTTTLEKSTFYYNFLSYSMMAGAIYVICLVLFSFNEEKLKKRIIVSSMSYKKQNRILLLSNCLFAFVLWLFYILLSLITCGEVILSAQGLVYIVNSFIFTFCCVTLAFLISSLVQNKNAINGIINVVALGSSFLCGAFVPARYLPEFVLKIAHILPTYWYINSNDIVKELEVIDLTTLKPIIINMIVILIFSLVFIIVSNLVSKKKQKIN